MLAEEVARYKARRAAHSNVEILVRHFVHPSNYRLAAEAMRRAAAAMGEEVDGQGVWPCLYGEIWLMQALATPQVLRPQE